MKKPKKRPMKRTMITATIMLVLSSLTALAAEPAAKVVRNFNEHEISIDAFGVLSRPDLTGAPRWGEGIGLNYFVTRGLGFGVRGVAYGLEGVFVDEVEARIIFRAPLWDRIAPYGFVSGVYVFDGEQVGAGAGGGLEFRFTPHISAFGETGVRISTDGANDWQTSAGVRFIF